MIWLKVVPKSVITLRKVVPKSVMILLKVVPKNAKNLVKQLIYKILINNKKINRKYCIIDRKTLNL